MSLVDFDANSLCLGTVSLGRTKEVCLSPLGPLASMADVSAAGIELPNGVTVAISSPMFLCAIYM